MSFQEAEERTTYNRGMLMIVPEEARAASRKPKTPSKASVKLCLFAVPGLEPPDGNSSSTAGICGERAFYGPRGGGCVRCGEHREPWMVNQSSTRALGQRCMFEVAPGDTCGSRALFAQPGEDERVRCTEHREPHMVNPFRQRCAFEGCNRNPFFGYPGTEKRLRCAKHKEAGMVDIKSKRCLAEGCVKFACWGLKDADGDGGGAMWCSDHMQPGMFNFRAPHRSGMDPECIRTRDSKNNKMCAYPNCSGRARYGLPGDLPRNRRCRLHKTLGMVSCRLSTCACSVEGCDRKAVCGPRGEKPSEKKCALHRAIPASKSATKTLCYVMGCERGAVWGWDDGERMRCSKHKEDGMINLAKVKDHCKVPGCSTVPSFGFLGERPLRTRCRVHAEEGMVDVKHVGREKRDLHPHNKAHSSAEAYKSRTSFRQPPRKLPRAGCPPPPPIPPLPLPSCPPPNRSLLVRDPTLGASASAFDHHSVPGGGGGLAALYHHHPPHVACDAFFDGPLPMPFVAMEWCEPMDVASFGVRFPPVALVAPDVGWYPMSYGGGPDVLLPSHGCLSDDAQAQIVAGCGGVGGNGSCGGWLGRPPPVESALISSLGLPGMRYLPVAMQIPPAHEPNEALDPDAALVGILRPVPRGGASSSLRTPPLLQQHGAPPLDHVMQQQGQLFLAEHQPSPQDMQCPQFCAVPLPIHFSDQPSPHPDLDNHESPVDTLHVTGCVHEDRNVEDNLEDGSAGAGVPYLPMRQAGGRRLDGGGASLDRRHPVCLHPPGPEAVSANEGPPPVIATKSGWRCLHLDCPRRASYGFQVARAGGSGGRALRCAQHREPGMVNVIGRRCSEEGCCRLCVFGFPGVWPPVRCARHKLQGMEDLKNRRCAEDECNVRAEWGWKEEGGARWCRQHKESGMDYIGASLCDMPGCEHKPSFGLPHWEKGTRCARHKAQGMVNLVARKCAHADCTRPPIYGNPGERASVCARHKHDGMVTHGDVCKQLACRQVATHGHPSDPHPSWCPQHRAHEMIPLPHPHPRPHTSAPRPAHPPLISPEKSNPISHRNRPSRTKHPSSRLTNDILHQVPTGAPAGPETATQSITSTTTPLPPGFSEASERERAGAISACHVQGSGGTRAKCASPGCAYPAFYGLPDHPRPSRCYVHKARGMVSWCQESPPVCDKYAVFGYTTIGLPTRCQGHAMDGMVSLIKSA